MGKEKRKQEFPVENKLVKGNVQGGSYCFSRCSSLSSLISPSFLSSYFNTAYFLSLLNQNNIKKKKIGRRGEKRGGTIQEEKRCIKRETSDKAEGGNRISLIMVVISAREQ